MEPVLPILFLLHSIGITGPVITQITASVSSFALWWSSVTPTFTLPFSIPGYSALQVTTPFPLVFFKPSKDTLEFAPTFGEADQEFRMAWNEDARLPLQTEDYFLKQTLFERFCDFIRPIIDPAADRNIKEIGRILGKYDPVDLSTEIAVAQMYQSHLSRYMPELRTLDTLKTPIEHMTPEYFKKFIIDQVNLPVMSKAKEEVILHMKIAYNVDYNPEVSELDFQKQKDYNPEIDERKISQNEARNEMIQIWQEVRAIEVVEKMVGHLMILHSANHPEAIKQYLTPEYLPAILAGLKMHQSEISQYQALLQSRQNNGAIKVELNSKFNFGLTMDAFEKRTMGTMIKLDANELKDAINTCKAKYIGDNYGALLLLNEKDLLEQKWKNLVDDKHQSKEDVRIYSKKVKDLTKSKLYEHSTYEIYKNAKKESEEELEIIESKLSGVENRICEIDEILKAWQIPEYRKMLPMLDNLNEVLSAVERLQASLTDIHALHPAPYPNENTDTPFSIAEKCFQYYVTEPALKAYDPSEYWKNKAAEERQCLGEKYDPALHTIVDMGANEVMHLNGEIPHSAAAD